MWTFKVILNLVLLLQHHTGLMGWIYLSPYVALRYIKCPPPSFFIFSLCWQHKIASWLRCSRPISPPVFSFINHKTGE